MIRILSLLALALASLASPAPAGGMVIFQGLPGQVGDVRVVFSGGGSSVPIGLESITLLPVDVNGRSELERFLPGKAWLAADVPFASRVVLPQRRGSVYHYRRVLPGEGATFGYFLVDADGDASSFFDLIGTGVGFSVDPFLPRVAVSPDGLTLLIGTTPEAGGDLFEVPLFGGGAKVRTQALPPLQLVHNSLTIHDTWGLAVAQTGIVRFQRQSSDDATFLTYSGPPPDWWPGDVVLSGNGAFAATIASDTAPLGHVWVFGPTGAAVRVSQTARLLSGAGYLPEALQGPFMAVSDDGTLCAWRSEGLTREAFLAKVQPPPGQSPQQVSADAWFLDTLDEIGQYSFRPGSRDLLLAVGARGGNAPFTLESTDYFAVTLDDAGLPVFQAITQTSGLSQPPFLAVPALDPLAASWMPAHDALVFHDDQGGDQGSLRFLRPGQVGAQVLLDDVKEVRRVDRVDGDLVVVLRRSTGAKDLELHHVAAPLAGTAHFYSAADVDEFPLVAARTDSVYAFVHRRPTFEWLWSYSLRTGGVGLLTPRKLRFGPTLAVGPDDELGVTVGKLGLSNVFAVWRWPAPPKRLPVVQQPGFYLPGI